jgi:hypothetical protein
VVDQSPVDPNDDMYEKWANTYRHGEVPTVLPSDGPGAPMPALGGAQVRGTKLDVGALGDVSDIVSRAIPDIIKTAENPIASGARIVRGGQFLARKTGELGGGLSDVLKNTDIDWESGTAKYHEPTPGKVFDPGSLKAASDRAKQIAATSQPSAPQSTQDAPTVGSNGPPGEDGFFGGTGRSILAPAPEPAPSMSDIKGPQTADNPHGLGFSWGKTGSPVNPATGRPDDVGGTLETANRGYQPVHGNVGGGGGYGTIDEPATIPAGDLIEQAKRTQLIREKAVAEDPLGMNRARALAGMHVAPTLQIEQGKADIQEQEAQHLQDKFDAATETDVSSRLSQAMAQLDARIKAANPKDPAYARLLDAHGHLDPAKVIAEQEANKVAAEAYRQAEKIKNAEKASTLTRRGGIGGLYGRYGPGADQTQSPFAR